ncbi:hypothetical protein AAAC51_10190 [Priestia megaterium]
MITDANTGEELKRLNFSFSVVGKAAYDKYDAFFEDPYFEVTNMETKETLTLKTFRIAHFISHLKLQIIRILFSG